MPGWPLEVVISGGQEGSDQAGVCAARFLNYTTGGMAPRGFRTESGPAAWLAEFGLTASPVDSYKSRTYHNVIHADGTVIFTAEVLESADRIAKKRQKDRAASLATGGLTPDALFTSYGLAEGSGSRYTATLTIAHRKHLMINPIEAEQLRHWIYMTGIRTLNVAGTRESKAPGIYQWVYAYLVEALVPF